MNKEKKIYPWGHGRRFNAYTEYIKKLFGERVQKVTLDAGFTCPNRDGTISTGGCTFCNNNAFNPSYCSPAKPIKQQIKEGITFHARRYKGTTKYLAYFQAYSNTYGPVDFLRYIFEEALSYPGIEGIVIGTRPDCIDAEKLDLLAEIHENHHVMIEYGVESCYNETLRAINRGHTFQQSVEAIKMTSERGIQVGAHLIIGLPGESNRQLLNSMDRISELPITTLKFHQLQIVKDTRMAKDYSEGKLQVHLYTVDEYISQLIDLVERLNPAIVIERIAGETTLQYQAGNMNWSLRYYEILQMFENELARRNTWQGRLYNTTDQ